MEEQFLNLGQVWQAFIATCFTWFVTALGAATVFYFKQVNRKLLDGMLGFAAGVMIAASYWSLLAPAIQMTRETNDAPAWFPAAIGFLAGGAFIRVIDQFLPHLTWDTQPVKQKAFPHSGGEVFCLFWRSRCIIFPKAWRSALPLARSRQIYRRQRWLGQLRLQLVLASKIFLREWRYPYPCAQKACLH